jgi:hypothetical protein
MAKEKKELNELHSKLRSNATFQQLTNRQKRRVLERGEWRWLPGNNKQISWRQIASNAGLAEILSSHMYRHLSGYAHSSSLSTLQIKQSVLNE